MLDQSKHINNQIKNMYMPGQLPFNNVMPDQFTCSIQQGMYQTALYPNAPYVNQWTPYGWVPLMAPQPIPPPPCFFPYGYPWQQQMQPNFVNMGLQYQENNGSSQFGNPSYNQHIDLQQQSPQQNGSSQFDNPLYNQQEQNKLQPPQQNGSSQNGNPCHHAQTQPEQLPQHGQQSPRKLSATVVDTSTDASLVQMSVLPDASQLMKTCADAESCGHVIKHGAACKEMLQVTQVQESGTLRTPEDVVA